MSQRISSFQIGTIFYQSGYGYPTHIATRGCTYIDIDTGIEYINKDGLVNWVPFLDGSTVITGGTSGSTSTSTFTGGTYSSGTTILSNNTGGTITITGYTYIPHLEYNNSNSTLWNNGFGNISTNISYGQNALVSNTSGTYNTAIGGESLSATTSGDFNTGIGGGSLTNNTIGVQNFGIGSFALYYNTTGSYNTAIGTAALQDNTTAERNVAIGGFSLYRNTGDRNIAIGFYAGVATKGSDNILLGANANNITDGLVSGSNNTIIGTLLSGVVNGSNNTIFGKPTGLSSATTNNIVIADGSGNIRFRDDNINTILPRLVGSGDRIVIASPNGELSARTITDAAFTGYHKTTGITSSQTISWDKTYWGVSANTNVNLILPSVVSKEGYYLIIKDESGFCDTYRIRITPTSGLIDKNNYVDMNIKYMSLTCIVRDGNWYLI